MAEIGIHEHNVIVLALVETVDVGGTETELAGAGSQNNLVGTVDPDEVLDAFLSAIGRGIVDNDDFHLDVPTS